MLKSPGSAGNTVRTLREILRSVLLPRKDIQHDFRKGCIICSDKSDIRTGRRMPAERIKLRFMKRTAVFLIAAMLIFTAFTGCRNRNEEEETCYSGMTAGFAELDENGETVATTSFEDAEESAYRILTPEDYCYGMDENGSYTAEDAVPASAELPDFASFVFSRAELEPSEETISGILDSITSKYGTHNTDTSRVIREGDSVSISYTGFVDGVRYDECAAEDQLVVAGADNYVGDFLSQLIGRHPGDLVHIQVTFPESYPDKPEFANKPGIFFTTINFVVDSPAFDDDFVRVHQDILKTYDSTGRDFDSAESFIDFIKEIYFTQNLKEAVSAAVTDYIKTLTPTETMLETARYAAEVQIYSKNSVSLRSYQKSMKYTDEEMDALIYEQAQEMTFYQMMTEEFGWKATDEEIAARIGSGDTEAQLARYGRGYFANSVLKARADAWILEQVTVR